MIFFHNLRISSIRNNSGVFAGRNIQYCWSSLRSSAYGFGCINGNSNALQCPVIIETTPGAEDPLREFYRILSASGQEGGVINGKN